MASGAPSAVGARWRAPRRGREGISGAWGCSLSGSAAWPRETAPPSARVSYPAGRASPTRLAAQATDVALETLTPSGAVSLIHGAASRSRLGSEHPHAPLMLDASRSRRGAVISASAGWPSPLDWLGP